jgi:hypothetical protein
LLGTEPLAGGIATLFTILLPSGTRSLAVYLELDEVPSPPLLVPSPPPLELDADGGLIKFSKACTPSESTPFPSALAAVNCEP